MSVFTRRLTPRHPLAQCAIEQIERLELRPQYIIAQMGYQPKNFIQAYDRLRHVLCSPNLGLDNSYYDYRYSSSEFIQELFAVLDIAPEHYQAELEQIHCQIDDFVNRPRYSLRATIDFDFSTSNANNWLTRMGVASFYEINLPIDFYQLEHTEQQSLVQQLIQAHYQQHHDSLPYHGIIKGYVLSIERGEEVEQVTYKIPCL